MSYPDGIVNTLRCTVWMIALFCAIIGTARTAQASAQVQDNGNFGAKFVGDLRSLFGTLQQSDLDQAFERAKPIQCSDLAGLTAWKDVAFLNEDRRLSNWHYDGIEEARNDPVRIVFSGICIREDAPLQVAT